MSLGSSLAGPLSGHVWTLASAAASAVRRSSLPRSLPWHTVVGDVNGSSLVRLTGRLHIAAPPASDELAVVLHGLGGSCQSHDVRRTTRALLQAGVSCLRLNARGADGSGSGLSHAGSTTDLACALESPEARRFHRLYLIGFAHGGHVALRYATENPGARLRGVAAICAPLDLDRTTRAIDGPRWSPYRRHLLQRLRAVYRAVLQRRGGPISMARARQIRLLREWDRLVIAPRFGFASAEDYYARVSVARRLVRLQCPALVIATRYDPLVPLDSIRAALAQPAPLLTGRLVAAGGHAALAPWLDLGFGTRRGLEAQILTWLRRTNRANTAPRHAGGDALGETVNKA